jgi:hypothetical protein
MEWFYTAPIEDISVRRGDPLGMRAAAEDMAEMLAPGLSNRTTDARWISILCWALDQSYSAWRAVGSADDDGTVGTPQAGKELYRWLRPLEMLWLARTVTATDDRGKGRQMPGVRAVRRWLNDDPRPNSFDPSAYERYRFTGIYGAYRVALRSLPGLTVGGDGWRLDTLGRDLAKLVGSHVQYIHTHRMTKGRRPEPERYWERSFHWQRGTKDYLPTLLARPKRLPNPERDFLRRALFSSDGGSDEQRAARVRRRAVAEAAASSSAATRWGLLADVARVLGKGRIIEELRLLSPFCELADAGIEAMNACWRVVIQGNYTTTGFARVSEVLTISEIRDALDALASAAKRWQREATKAHRRVAVADELAEGILKSGDQRIRQLQAILRHHGRFGGGLKWVAVEGDAIKPLAPVTAGAASEYAFRITALSRLGVQCGIIEEMPRALRTSAELAEEDEA